jgi:hypothetical protein
MLILRNHADLSRVDDLSLRSLLTQRFAERCAGAIDDYDPDILGDFVLVEAKDTVARLEAETDAWIGSSPFSALRYGDPGFLPLFEVLEEHPTCFEMVFVLNGDAGLTLLIPKQSAMDGELLQICRAYPEPAPA